MEPENIESDYTEIRYLAIISELFKFFYSIFLFSPNFLSLLSMFLRPLFFRLISRAKSSDSDSLEPLVRKLKVKDLTEFLDGAKPKGQIEALTNQVLLYTSDLYSHV